MLPFVVSVITLFLAASGRCDTRLYVATENKGISISDNNGQTWVVRNSTDGLAHDRTACVSAALPNMIFVGTDFGLSLSYDNGKSWSTVLPNFCLSVFALPDKIYVGTNNDGLAISDDDGQTWSMIDSTSGLADNTVYAVFALLNKIYAATIGGLSLSEDNGKTWITRKLLNNNLHSVFATEKQIFVGTGGGLGISDTNGQTWASYLTASFIQAVFVSNGTIYAGTSCNGLAMSADNGQTWITIDKTKELISNDIRSIYVSGSRIYVGTKGGGLSVSEDGGQTWLSRSLNDNDISSVFVLNTTVHTRADKNKT